MRFLAMMFTLLLLPAIVLAQAPTAGTLVDQVGATRLELERLGDARQALMGQRDSLSKDLESLASRIETHKQSRPAGGLLPDFILHQMLQQSQEISGKITLINHELDALDRVRLARREALTRLYDALLESLAAAVRQAPAERQPQLVRDLARVRRERDELRPKAGPATTGSKALSLDSAERWLASEDPEELSERADAVRDEQDRLRKVLARLDRRASEIRADSRLDREMQDFLGDQNLFGEESRTLRISSSKTYESSTAAPHDSAKRDDNANPSPGGYADGDLGWAGEQGGGECSGGLCGTPADPGGGSAGIPTFTVVTRDGQVPLQLGQDGGPQESLDPATELRRLSEQRQQAIEQIKKLQVLHDRLRDKAEALSDQ